MHSFLNPKEVFGKDNDDDEDESDSKPIDADSNACAACTFINDDGWIRCNMCGTKKPRRASITSFQHHHQRAQSVSPTLVSDSYVDMNGHCGSRHVVSRLGGGDSCSPSLLLSWYCRP